MTGVSPSRGDEPVLVSIGSNLGDRWANMDAAVRFLATHPQMNLEKVTDVIETEPWGGVPQPSFLNAAARLTTTLSPRALLLEFKCFEQRMGRDPDGLRWGPRVIDVDILKFGDRTIFEENLIIPHPHIKDRVFIQELLRVLFQK